MTIIGAIAVTFSAVTAASAVDWQTLGKELHDCGYGWENFLARRIDLFHDAEPGRSPTRYVRNVLVQLPPGTAPAGQRNERNYDHLLKEGELGHEYWSVESATARSLYEKSKNQIPKDAATVGATVWWDKRPEGPGPIKIKGHVYHLMFTPSSEWQAELRERGLMWSDVISGNNNFDSFPADQRLPLRWQQKIFYRIPGIPDGYKVFRTRPRPTTATVGKPLTPPPVVRDPDAVEGAIAKAEALRILLEYVGTVLHRWAANAVQERVNKKIALAIAEIAQKYPAGETVWVEVTWGGYEVTVKNEDAIRGLLEAGKDAAHCLKFEEGGTTKFRIGYEREDGWVLDTQRQSCELGATTVVEDPTIATERRARLDTEHPPRWRQGLEPNDRESWVYEVERICVEGTAPWPDQRRFAAILVESAGAQSWSDDRAADFPGVEREALWYEARGYRPWRLAASDENILLALDTRFVKAISYFGAGSPNSIAGVNAQGWKQRLTDRMQRALRASGFQPYVADRLAKKSAANFGLDFVRNHSCGSLNDSATAHQFVKPGGRYFGVKNLACPSLEAVMSAKAEAEFTELAIPAPTPVEPGNEGFWAMDCTREGTTLRYGGAAKLMLDRNKVSLRLDLDRSFGDAGSLASEPTIRQLLTTSDYFAGSLQPGPDGVTHSINGEARKLSYGSLEVEATIGTSVVVLERPANGEPARIRYAAAFFGAGPRYLANPPFACGGSFATGPSEIVREDFPTP